VGVHSNDRSHHQGLPQPRYNAIEQRLLIAPALASIFVAPNFSTFATESAHSVDFAIRATSPIGQCGHARLPTSVLPAAGIGSEKVGYR
jgi:hypothetical protein